MFDQKLLFKIMLGALGLATVLGVGGVLFAAIDVVGRVTATAFVTSVSAAFLWQAAQRLERSLAAVMIAQTGILIFYVCTLLGLWGIGDDTRSWFTGFICLGCLIVVASGWAAQCHPDYRYTGLAAAVAALSSGVCWLLAIWTNDWTGFSGHGLAIGFAIAGWSAPAAVCLVGLGTEPPRSWRWIGVAAGGLGWLLTLVAIFNDYPQWTIEWLIGLGSLLGIVVHAVLCFASREAPQKFAIRTVAIVSTTLTVFLCNVILLLHFDSNQFLMRLAVASGILASTSTLATAFIVQRAWRQSRSNRTDGGRLSAGVLARNEAETSREACVSPYSSLHVTCPECQQPIEIPTGISACPHCQLQFRIEVWATRSSWQGELTMVPAR